MKKIKLIIKRRFPDIVFKKIILFKNPNECNTMYIERVNPNHVGIIWGRRKKKLHKGSSYIKIGKVYFGIVGISYALSVAGWLDMFTNYTFRILLSIGLLGVIIGCSVSILFYGTILKEVEKYAIKQS